MMNLAFLAAEGAVSIPTIVADVFSIAGQALDFVTSNAILTIFFAAPLVGIGISAIRRLKG